MDTHQTVLLLFVIAVAVVPAASANHATYVGWGEEMNHTSCVMVEWGAAKVSQGGYCWANVPGWATEVTVHLADLYPNAAGVAEFYVDDTGKWVEKQVCHPPTTLAIPSGASDIAVRTYGPTTTLLRCGLVGTSTAGDIYFTWS